MLAFTSCECQCANSSVPVVDKSPLDIDTDARLRRNDFFIPSREWKLKGREKDPNVAINCHCTWKYPETNPWTKRKRRDCFIHSIHLIRFHENILPVCFTLSSSPWVGTLKWKQISTIKMNPRQYKHVAMQPASVMECFSAFDSK